MPPACESRTRPTRCTAGIQAQTYRNATVTLCRKNLLHPHLHALSIAWLAWHTLCMNALVLLEFCIKDIAAHVDGRRVLLPPPFWFGPRKSGAAQQGFQLIGQVSSSFSSAQVCPVQRQLHDDLPVEKPTATCNHYLISYLTSFMTIFQYLHSFISLLR